MCRRTPTVAGQIKSTLERDDQVITDFMLGLEKEKSSKSYYTRGAGTVASSFGRVATEVEFGRLTPQVVAERLSAEWQKAVG